MKLLEKFDARHARPDVPEFRPGNWLFAGAVLIIVAAMNG